ncbi:hypothetical protein C8034_v006643 [Colletotrichum sidae]|uniref:Uncharacterized protein n=1 Tax=Colletotrichum sidae TaxID=1347389 RepID=A0A4R8S9Y4_9PEZI|nr:hypothetical protein C8034_v006643 [Colletotrichum sidae]
MRILAAVLIVAAVIEQGTTVINIDTATVIVTVLITFTFTFTITEPTTEPDRKRSLEFNPEFNLKGPQHLPYGLLLTHHGRSINRSVPGYIKTRSCEFGTTCGIASPNFPGLLACHTTVYTECVVKKIFDPCPQEKDGAIPVCRTYIGPRSNNPIALKMYACEPTSLGHETNVFLYQETGYLLPQTRSSGQTTGLTANNLSSMTVSDASTSGMTSTTGPLSTPTSTATPAATSDVPSTQAQTPVIVGGVIGGLVILGFVVCFVVWVRTRKPPAVSGPAELPGDQPVEHAGCELDAGGHRGRRREEEFLMPESPVIRQFGNDDFHSVRQRSDLSP